MFNDDTQEVVTSENNDTEHTAEETQETEETTTEETVDWEAEAKKLRAILTRDRKKAESKQNVAATPGVELVEETVLRSLGMEDELIEPLKKLARMNGQSLAQAQKDPLFIALKEKQESEKRAQSASVGVSKGSSQKSAKVDFSTPNLTQEQHKELWKKTMGA